MRKTIEFYPTNEEISQYAEPPRPMRDYRPQWIADMPRRLNNEKKFRFTNFASTNLTMRGCLPMMDAFDAGYALTLPCDVLFERTEDGGLKYQHRPLRDGLYAPIGVRDPISAPMSPWSEKHFGYEQLALNFTPWWSVRLPMGWSALFIHPLNRTDLPFYMLGGILDADGWGQAGNHPFILKENWEGVLEKGTPMVQVIPFKRAAWTKRVSGNWKQYWSLIYQRNSVLEGFYKKNVWVRKSFR